MAAFFSFLASVPSTASQCASVFNTRRVIERQTSHCAATAARVAAAMGEIGLFLWMAFALALSVVVMAGFFV
jgi:hypothetical protein